MTEYGLLVDLSLCFGCHTCEVACKQENCLPVGLRWISVKRIGPSKAGEELRMHFVPVMCMHCVKPPCLEACPTDAISKRSDGIVLINQDLCIGCKSCIQACPFGAIQYDDGRKVVTKCTMCVQRIKKGLAPSCVKHCPSSALLFGDINELTEQIREKHAKNLTRYGITAYIVTR